MRDGPLRRHDRGRRPRRPLRERQARAHRRRGQGVPQRPGQQRDRGARAGHRLLRGAADAEGQDARRPARASTTGDELLLDYASAPRCRRSSTRCGASTIGFDAELHKRTLQRGLLSLDRPGRRRPARTAGTAPQSAEHANASRDRRRAGCWSRTDVGIDVICDSDDTERVTAALLDGGRRRDRRGDGRGAARRARPPALRRRPRRLGDPPGGRAQRARRQLHQGLLRRPGDRRAAALARQAQPPPARAAAGRTGRSPAPSCGWASARSAGSRSVAVSPRFGTVGLALVRREAQPGDVLDAGGVSAEVVDLPFAQERG